MPITVRMRVGGKPRADFVTDDPCCEDIAAGEMQFVSERENRGRQYCRGVAAATAQVVEIFRVADRAVRKRSLDASRADIRADHARLRIAALFAREFQHDFSELRGRS